MVEMLDHPTVLIVLSLIGALANYVAAAALLMLIKVDYAKKINGLIRFQWLLFLVLFCSGTFALMEVFPSLGASTLRGVKMLVRVIFALSVFFYWDFNRKFYLFKDEDGTHRK